LPVTSVNDWRTLCQYLFLYCFSDIFVHILTWWYWFDGRKIAVILRFISFLSRREILC
jgi:hypothetical protein